MKCKGENVSIKKLISHVGENKEKKIRTYIETDARNFKKVKETYFPQIGLFN